MESPNNFLVFFLQSANLLPFVTVATMFDKIYTMPLMRSWQVWLAILLLVSGSIRIFQVVLHEPLYGYANQSDMGRMQYCFGIWPQQPSINPYAAHLSAPFSFYKMDGERSIS